MCSPMWGSSPHPTMLLHPAETMVSAFQGVDPTAGQSPLEQNVVGKRSGGCSLADISGEASAIVHSATSSVVARRPLPPLNADSLWTSSVLSGKFSSPSSPAPPNEVGKCGLTFSSYLGSVHCRNSNEPTLVRGERNDASPQLAFWGDHALSTESCPSVSSIQSLSVPGPSLCTPSHAADTSPPRHLTAPPMIRNVTGVMAADAAREDTFIAATVAGDAREQSPRDPAVEASLSTALILTTISKEAVNSANESSLHCCDAASPTVEVLENAIGKQARLTPLFSSDSESGYAEAVKDKRAEKVERPRRPLDRTSQSYRSFSVSSAEAAAARTQFFSADAEYWGANELEVRHFHLPLAERRASRFFSSDDGLMPVSTQSSDFLMSASADANMVPPPLALSTPNRLVVVPQTGGPACSSPGLLPSSPDRKGDPRAEAVAGAQSGALSLRSCSTFACSASRLPTGELETQVFTGRSPVASPVTALKSEHRCNNEGPKMFGQRESHPAPALASIESPKATWAPTQSPSLSATTCLDMPEVLKRISNPGGSAEAERGVELSDSGAGMNPHTPRGASTSSSALQLHSVVFSPHSSHSGPCIGGQPTSTFEREVPQMPPSPTKAAAMEGSEAAVSTPPSPRTPLANRTLGLVGMHKCGSADHSLSRSRSRYPSSRYVQQQSAMITPQKPSLRTLSRQTTPSISFRTRVQSRSFELQQCSGNAKAARDSGAEGGRTPTRGETAPPVRDYLAPSRNPFTPFRRVETYLGYPHLPCSRTEERDADATGDEANLLCDAEDLPEIQASFVAALERAVLRPDAAIVLFEQVVPNPLRGPTASRANPSDVAAMKASLAAVFECRSPNSRASPGYLPLFLPKQRIAPCDVSRARNHLLEVADLRPSNVAPAQPASSAPPSRLTQDTNTAPLSVNSYTDPQKTPSRAANAKKVRTETPLTPPLLGVRTAAPGVGRLPFVNPSATPDCRTHHRTGCPPSERRAYNTVSCLSPIQNVMVVDSSVSSPYLERCTTTSDADPLQQHRQNYHLWTDSCSPLPQPPSHCASTVAPNGNSRAGSGSQCVDRKLSFHAADEDEDDGQPAEQVRDDLPASPVVKEGGGETRGTKLLHPQSERCSSVRSSVARAGTPPLVLRPTLSCLGSCTEEQRSSITMISPPRQGDSSMRQRRVLDTPEHLVSHEGGLVAPFIPPLELTGMWDRRTPSLLLPPPLSQHHHRPSQFCELKSQGCTDMPQALVKTTIGHTSVQIFPQAGPRLMESLHDPLDSTIVSEEELPGDRFQEHHIFQFFHLAGKAVSAAAASESGVELSAPRAVPLSIEVNGVTWLAIHRLTGQPYAVKEVPRLVFNDVELRCLTLSSSSPRLGSPEGSASLGKSVGLSADDLLEAEDLILRYYGVSTPPQDAAMPAVHLLQMEYCPRGSLWERVTRRPLHHRASPVDSGSPHTGDGGALRGDFWHAMVTQGLRGLRVLHQAALLHGCPLPTSLYMTGHTPFSLQCKWGCFGNACEVDANVYPTASLPAWIAEVVAHRYRTSAAEGGTPIPPEVMEVSVFSLGMLELLVEYLLSRPPSEQLPYAPQTRNLAELEKIEYVVAHGVVELAVEPVEQRHDAPAITDLLRLLWDVANSSCTAGAVLAMLHVRLDTAVATVERVYEQEFYRLTTQVEEHKRHRRRCGRQSHPHVTATMSVSPSSRVLLPSSSTSYTTEANSFSARAVQDQHSSSVHNVSSSEPRRSNPLSGSALSRSHPSIRLTYSSPSTEAETSFASVVRRKASVSSAPFLSIPAECAVLNPPLNGGRGPGHHTLPTEIAPQVRWAAHRMLIRSLKTALQEEDPSITFPGMSRMLDATLACAVASMRLRGWRKLVDGIPLPEAMGTTACTAAADERKKEEDVVRASLRALRPLTSFE